MSKREQPIFRTPRWAYLLLFLVVMLLPALTVAAWWLSRHPFSLFEEATVRYAATHMTEELKRDYYATLARNLPSSIWEAIPEPTVARVLQFDIEKTSKGAEIVSNRAGMRSRVPYLPKPADRFRIVCLGDSMVMGTAGREEDRWGDQLQAMLTERDLRVDGRSVEVYSLGVGGWSGINESSYLIHRLSAYAPDLVLVMMVNNDFGDTPGVLGIGQTAFSFSPEFRHLGSGVLVDHWPFHFGARARNLLASGIGPESRGRWERVFQGWRRLESLLDETGGHMVLSVLRERPLFLELARLHHTRSGLHSPLIATGYAGKRLRHDPHPDREGHRILATHFLHVLAEQGWLPLDPETLPRLDAGLDARPQPPGDADAVRVLQAELVAGSLPASIDFAALDASQTRAVLGGLYPASADAPLAEPPHGSPRTALLLRRIPTADRVRVEVEVPPFPELYPFHLELAVDGHPAASLLLDSVARSGRHSLVGAIPEAGTSQAPAIELMLRTDAYWNTIDDFTMKSFRLLSVGQEEARR